MIFSIETQITQRNTVFYIKNNLVNLTKIVVQTKKISFFPKICRYFKKKIVPSRLLNFRMELL